MGRIPETGSDLRPGGAVQAETSWERGQTAARVEEVLMRIFTSLCAGAGVCLASENQQGALEVRGVCGVELWRLGDGHCVQECCEVEEMKMKSVSKIWPPGIGFGDLGELMWNTRVREFGEA